MGGHKAKVILQPIGSQLWGMPSLIPLSIFQILELARLVKILSQNPKIHNGYAHLAMYNFLIIKFQQNNVNLFGSPYANLPLGSL